METDGHVWVGPRKTRTRRQRLDSRPSASIKVGLDGGFVWRFWVGWAVFATLCRAEGTGNALRIMQLKIAGFEIVGDVGFIFLPP